MSHRGVLRRDLERHRHAAGEALERSRKRLTARWERRRVQGLALAIEYMLPHLIGVDAAELAQGSP